MRDPSLCASWAKSGTGAAELCCGAVGGRGSAILSRCKVHEAQLSFETASQHEDVVQVEPGYARCFPTPGGLPPKQCRMQGGELIGSFIPSPSTRLPEGRVPSCSSERASRCITTAWFRATHTAARLSAPILDFRHPVRQGAAYRSLDAHFPILKWLFPILAMRELIGAIHSGHSILTSSLQAVMFQKHTSGMVAVFEMLAVRSAPIQMQQNCARSKATTALIGV